MTQATEKHFQVLPVGVEPNTDRTLPLSYTGHSLELQSLTRRVGTPTPIPHSNVGLHNVAELLVHSVSVLSKNRQQSYALIFACYTTLKRGGGGVTKYFDVSSEEKAVNDQDCDTDCLNL